MSRWSRKTVVSATSPQAEPTTPHDAPLAEEPEPHAPDYRVERWEQYNNYCCNHCPYSTLHKELIEQHIRMHR